MNAQRFNVYVSVNAIRPGRRARTKDAIGAVRHIFLEADDDGPKVLATIAVRGDLPTHSYVLQSSPGRMHVFWRVHGFTAEDAERLQKHLAHELGTDAAATSCSQTTRLPGYRNHKRTPASPRDNSVRAERGAVHAARLSGAARPAASPARAAARNPRSLPRCRGTRPPLLVPRRASNRRPAWRPPHVSSVLSDRPRVRTDRQRGYRGTRRLERALQPAMGGG